ncbi:tryptophan-rich sensory protein [Agromyces silvae]|uniref:tryptophan-rich sensory protein n=1 Tax=Agromyces silvae TaxID=3388266 RepID=UPI00280B03A4|nr:tryptophan-rich sensory protein [Agromyces protaetiae]
MNSAAESPALATSTAADTVRHVVVAVSAVLAVVGAFIGSGAAGGTPIAEAAGGALAADATLIAPAGPAFAIWTLIYLGLLAYAVWQFFPSVRAAERHRVLGYPIAASMLLNAAWILSIQAGLLWLSVVVIIVLLAVLCWLYATCIRRPPHALADALVTDGTIGLYLGWVSVATAANVTAALVASGFDGWGLPPEMWSIIVIEVAAIAIAVLGVISRGGLAPMLAASWGLAWVAVGRLTGEPYSVATGVAAIIGIVLIVGATLTARFLTGRDRRLGPVTR